MAVIIATADATLLSPFFNSQTYGYVERPCCQINSTGTFSPLYNFIISRNFLTNSS